MSRIPLKHHLKKRSIPNTQIGIMKKTILRVVGRYSRITVFGLGLLLSQRCLFATVDVQPLSVTPGSGSVAPGGSLYVSWQIRNNGTTTAASSYSQVRITTSSSSYGNSANNVGSGVATGTIGAGATINQNETVTVPSSPGTYYVWVIADNTRLLTQTSVATDEAVSSSFTVTSAGTVDVQPLNVTPGSGSVAPGGSLYVSWQILNNGTATAASSYSQVRITTSSSSYGSSANNVGSGVATGTIGAGATINQNETVTVPSSPGTYYVWVIADNTSLLTQTSVANDEAVSSSFTITGGTPTISSVSPNPVVGSNSKQTFNVYGSGFVSGAQVALVWPAVGAAPAGNATLSATYISSSQLQVSATFGNDPATWTAQVINPGSITSSTYSFPLQAPVPVIQFLSPSGVATGGAAFTLAVNGSTFDQGSIVYWNGVSLPTTPVVSSGGLTTVLQAQVPASDIASAGTATVTVFNPSPGGGTSAGVSFNVGSSSTTTSQGVDYSVNPPNLSALKAAGYGFVIRYVSAAGNAKNITSSEAQTLQAAGLGIIIVFESTANEMQNGYSAGVADANTAVTTATAAGAPANFFCYFACDFDAQPSDQTAINAYLDGAASVLGVSRVGFYGGYAPLKNVLDAGKATKGWQTTAWSSGNIDPRISLYQYLYNQTSAGGSYDIDEGFGSDLGQWSATPIDTTPPALTISSPANNATVTSASLAVSGTASDSGFGNNGVSSVTVNGTSATGGTASGSGTATWNATVTLVSGANTITVIAKDTLNNSTTKQITVTYNPPDVTPPTVAISSPTGGQTFTTSPVTVSGTATDPGTPSSGVSLVQVQVNSTSGTWQTASGTTSWSASVALSSGANTIYVRSQDGAGNYSTIGSVSVTYTPDTTAPTVSITAPTAGQRWSNAVFTVAGTAHDNVQATNVSYQLNGSGWNPGITGCKRRLKSAAGSCV